LSQIRTQETSHGIRALADSLGVDRPFIQRGRDLRCKAKDLSNQHVSRQESGTTYNGRSYYADHQKGSCQGYQWDAKWAEGVHQFPSFVTTDINTTLSSILSDLLTYYRIVLLAISLLADIYTTLHFFASNTIQWSTSALGYFFAWPSEVSSFLSSANLIFTSIDLEQLSEREVREARVGAGAVMAACWD
jgi:hypothetical protein